MAARLLEVATPLLLLVGLPQARPALISKPHLPTHRSLTTARAVTALLPQHTAASGILATTAAASLPQARAALTSRPHLPTHRSLTTTRAVTALLPQHTAASSILATTAAAGRACRFAGRRGWRHPPPKLQTAVEESADRPPFCLETALLLAGFAFETYNQPEVIWERSTDGTRTAILSPAFLREHFDGVLAVDAVKAELFRPSSLLPLQPLDTYLVLQLTDAEPVRTSTVRGTQRPEWSDGHFLYVRNPETSTLVLSIYFEKPLGGTPELLGRAQVPVRELFDTSLRLWGEQRGLTGGGRIEIKAAYVPLSDKMEVDVAKLQAVASELSGSRDIAGSIGALWSKWKADRALEATTGVRGDRRGARLTSQKLELFDSKTWFDDGSPKGVRGAASVDWSELCLELGGAAASGSLAFEACCFVENEKTNTQCGIWRQDESRTLVVSFRGTQQDALQDILTDLSFLQRPATPRGETLTAEGRRATLRQGEASRALGEQLEGALASLRGGDEALALDQLSSIQLAAEELRAAVKQRERLVGIEEPRDESVDGVPPRVHSGFYGALQSVLPAVLRLIKMCTGSVDGIEPAADMTMRDGSRAGDGWTILVTGHSLGGALATLMAWEIEAIRAAELPSVSSVQLYNFGSPRVGNAAFAHSFNSAIPVAWRIINGLDIVARVPRANNLSFAGEWQQVGRTVLLRPETAGADCEIDGIWIEGEDVGACPIKCELAPMPLAMGNKGFETLLAGLKDSGFVQRELSILRTLVGDGIAHHLEDSYHEGMTMAVKDWSQVLSRRSAAESPRQLPPTQGGDRPADKVIETKALAAEADAESLAQLDSIVSDELEQVLKQGGDGDDQMIQQLVPKLKRRAAQEVPGLVAVPKGVNGAAGVVESIVEDRVREAVRRLLAGGAWNVYDLSLLLRIVLVLATAFSPAASLLPVRVLLTTYSSVLATELGERLIAEVTAQLQARLAQGIADSVRGFTGKREYQFGDITKEAVSRATGKAAGEYEFGDITRAAISRVTDLLAGGDESRNPDGSVKKPPTK